jgi:hypothetical protein
VRFGLPTAADAAIGLVRLDPEQHRHDRYHRPVPGRAAERTASGQGAISAVTGSELLVSDAMAVWGGWTLRVDAAPFVGIGTSGNPPPAVF